LQFLANDKLGRRVVYAVLPRSVKDSFVVDCSKNTVQLGPIKYKKEIFLCRYLCQSPGKECVFTGLDNNQQFGTIISH
jgi:hypothetical protein